MIRRPPVRSLRFAGLALAVLVAVLVPLWQAVGPGLVAGFLGPDLAGAPGPLRLHALLDPGARDVAYFSEMATAAGTRLLATLAVILLVLGLTSWPRALKRMFAEPDSDRELALARILVFGALALYVSPAEIGRFAALPAELWAPPPGWSPFSWAMRPVPWLAEWVGWALVALSLGAAAGLAPRITSWSAVFLGLYVLGIPQMYGKVNHYHHLVWFAALVAAAPAWRVWSLSPGATPASGPVRIRRWMWMLIALIYFFPGFWKWVVAGPQWLDGSALATMLQSQWYRIGATPAVRFDQGLLAPLAGTAVLVFELGFLWAMPFRPARRLFLAGAVAFHAGVLLVAGISFWSLVALLPVFVPIRDDTESPAPTGLPMRGDRLGGSLVALALMTGFLHLDSWPVAVYPTFAGVSDAVYPTVVLEAHPGGTVDPYRSEGLADAFGQSRIMGLVGQVGGPQDWAAAEALGDLVADYEPVIASADTVDVVRLLVELRPEASGAEAREILVRVIR